VLDAGVDFFFEQVRAKDDYEFITANRFGALGQDLGYRFGLFIFDSDGIALPKNARPF
jgi:hypothetical protein